MTNEATFWHREYEGSKPVIRQAVDSSFSLVRNCLVDRGFSVANDDRAEILIAAIMEYLTESADPSAAPSWTPKASRANTAHTKFNCVACGSDYCPWLVRPFPEEFFK
jgi:hypothetical protein